MEYFLYLVVVCMHNLTCYGSETIGQEDVTTEIILN